LLAVAVLSGIIAWYLKPTPSRLVKVSRFVIPADVEMQQGAPIALSRDGTKLVYVGREQGRSSLFLRRLDNLESVPIPGTAGAQCPFFSPDAEWVGFFAGGELKKVALRGALELAPNYWQFHLISGLAYWGLAKDEEGLEAFSRARDLARGEPMTEASYGMACARVGKRHEAVEILERLKGRREERYFPALYIAWLAWILDDLDEAFKWVHIAYDERDGLLTQLAALPEYDSIRKDPRFQNLLHRMNFPEDLIARTLNGN
jgi:hypothetical protein